MRTLNQSAQDAFARLAHDFSKDWIPVRVVWQGDYVPEGTQSKFPENCIISSIKSVRISFSHEPEKTTEYGLKTSFFGWSYREGFKEGILTKKEKVKVFRKNFNLFWCIPLFPLYSIIESPSTLKEILASLATEMPHLSHFAIYTVNEEMKHAEFELYKIPKNVFQFNTKM